MENQRYVNYCVRLHREELDALLQMALSESIHTKKTVRAANLIRAAIHQVYPQLQQGFNREQVSAVGDGVKAGV